MQYRAEIDGLRALAVVPVILFHAGFTTFGGGYVGVDVFFVISGYLITTIIINEMQRGKFSLLDFYERRARRILPALFVMMAACIPFAWAWLSPRDIKDFFQSMVATSLFSSNILFWIESGYFDTAAELKPLLHTWSLAVEEQYYIFFPLFLMFAWRFGAKFVVASLSIAFVVSLALAQWAAYHQPSAAFYLLPTRIWELLVGAFVAFYLVRNPDLERLQVNQVCSAFGLFLIAFAVFGYDAKTPFPGFYAIVPTLGAALVILFSRQGTAVHYILSHRLLVGVGLISYSAYLWHQPIFAFARYRSLSHPSPTLMALLCVVSLIAAYFSWLYIETTFRKKTAFSRRRMLTLSTLGLLAFMSVGGAGYLFSGSVERFGEDYRLAFDTAVPSPKRGECHTGGEAYLHPMNACRYFNENPTWVVVGDSHAVELAYGLAEVLNDTGDGVRHMSFSACKPSYGLLSDDPCAVWTGQAVEEINNAKDLTNVVVSYRIAYALFGDHEEEYPRLPSEFDSLYRDEVWGSYMGMLDSFIDAGKNVYLVIQAPEVKADINRIIPAGNLTHLKDVEGISRQWWDARMSYVEERLSDIPVGVKVINPKDFFCDASSCYAIKNGKSLYFDGNHISVSGAKLIAQEVAKAKGALKASHGSEVVALP